MKRLFYFICMGLVGLTLTACDNGNEDGDNDDNNGTGTVVDVEGNVYKTVKIGNQIWMAENLRTTKYNDGTDIPAITTSSAWNYSVTTPAHCWYSHDSSTYKQWFGALYNWYAVNTGKLAPAGWHVPTVADWNELSEYVSAHLGTSSSLAKALASKTNWMVSNTEGYISYQSSTNNSTGFNAIPAGIHANLAFGNYGTSAYWWSSETYGDFGQFASLRNNTIDRMFIDTYAKYYGLSVRCVKNR